MSPAPNDAKEQFDPFKEATITCPYSIEHKVVDNNQTVLQQHCAFWDTDKDGEIWPLLMKFKFSKFEACRSSV